MTAVADAAANASLHRSLLRQEAILRYFELSAFVRLPTAGLIYYVNSQTGGCWDSIDISISASATDSNNFMNVERNAIPISVSVLFIE